MENVRSRQNSFSAMYIHVPLFAHERTSTLKYLYVFIKEKISSHSSQTQTLLAFKPINLAVNENANLFVDKKLNNILPRIFLYILKKV